MDVGLIDIDQLIAIALCAVLQRAKVLDELHPPRRIGTPQQFADLLPGESEPVQGTADALTAQQAIKAVLHEPHKPLELQRGGGSAPAIGGSPAACWAGRIALRSAAAIRGQKGGRPPVRRYSSAAGPCSL